MYNTDIHIFFERGIRVNCTSGGKLRSQSRVVNYEKHYKCFA